MSDRAKVSSDRPDRVQLADRHLVYIRTPSFYKDWTVYDVYRSDRGGPQLGTVTGTGGRWIAEDGGAEKIARTRWEAAIALWPAADALEQTHRPKEGNE